MQGEISRDLSPNDLIADITKNIPSASFHAHSSQHVASFTCEFLLPRMRAVEVAPSSPLVPKSTSKRAQSGPMSAACHMDDVPCRKSGVDGHRSSARIIGWRQELCWRRGRLRRRVTQSHRNHRRRTGVVVWYMCAPRGVKAGVFARVLGRLSVYLFCLCF